MTQIKINKEPVELFKILKFEGVNGSVETQKRKKIVAGDNIGFMEQEYQIVLE